MHLFEHVHRLLRTRPRLLAEHDPVRLVWLRDEVEVHVEDVLVRELPVVLRVSRRV